MTLSHRPTVVERAFELARSGHCRSFTEIVRQLSCERFDSIRQHLDGHAIRAQLKVEILAGRQSMPTVATAGSGSPP